jgi:hypothetical protein
MMRDFTPYMSDVFVTETLFSFPFLVKGCDANEYFFVMFDRYEDFARVMDKCTENHSAIVMDNTTGSCNVDEKVFSAKRLRPGGKKLKKHKVKTNS